MVTYLCRNVTIVCGASYHLLGSQISPDSKVWFRLQVKPHISNWRFSESQHLARYVSRKNAIAYDSTLKKLNFLPIVDGFNYFLPRVQAHVNTHPIQASIHMCLASWGGCFLPNAVGGLLCLASGTLLYNQHRQNRHKTHNTQQPTR
jgi:hypothetical protein